MIYLNNAGTSWPKPDTVAPAVARALAAPPDSWPGLLADATRDVAELLRLPAPERLLFTPGCTSALSIAISQLPWQPGERVLTSALEHHAVVGPIGLLASRRGVEHEVAPYRPGNPIDLDWVRDRLRAGAVRLIATTAASNVTGEVLPVAELSRLAHEHGAVFLLDAAQMVGVLPVDVGALGADIVTFAGHKGPLGPHGVGGLWAADGLAFSASGALCEIDAPDAAPPREQPMPGYCEAGGANVAGLAGLSAGLAFHRERGLDATGGKAVRLAAALRAAVATRPGVELLGGTAGPHTAAVGLRLPALRLAETEAFFAARGLVVRAGTHCAPMALDAVGAPGGSLRISFGPFNGEADVEAALAVIDEAAQNS